MTDHATSVLDHGAIPDGRTVCTRQLQAAIDHAAAHGGCLVVPPGEYLTGTLHLRSDLVVDLRPGAVLRGSPDIADYEHGYHDTAFNKDLQPYHLLVLQGLRNITIRGGGRIDGNGPAFWEPITAPDRWVRELSRRPSPMIQCGDCVNLSWQDVEIANSPGWTLHLHRCTRVKIRGISILNHLYGPNTDGIDIDGCQDVLISDCVIEAGDDAIVLKTTPDSRPCERVVVTNCTIATNCRALKLGAMESFHDMRQVAFTNCVVRRSVAIFALYSRNGAVFEDIVVSNITGVASSNGDFDQPIHIDLCRINDDRPRGGIRNVLVENIICRSSGRILLTAEPGSWLDNISLRHVLFQAEGTFDPHPRGLTAKGLQFSPRSPLARAARAAVVADRVRGLRIDGVQTVWPESMPAPFYAIWHRECPGALLPDPATLAASDPSVPAVHAEPA